MKTKLVLLFSFLALPLFAQNTAFTYQGRLNDSNGPANGLYDFTFTLYDSTNSPGVVTAGPLTNPATSVSNGSFTAALDFGGIFDGAPRWIEIAVRTNGDSGFLTLSPRQPITPTPVALFANNASNALTASTVPLGSVTSAQLAPQSVSQTNLALPEAVSLVCGNIAAYGLRRFAWPKTETKWASQAGSGGPFFFSTVGSGWVLDSEFGGVATNILAYMPFAGFASTTGFQLPSFLNYGPVTGMDTALLVNGDDTNWHTPYFVLTNTGNIVSPVALPAPSAVNGLIVSDVTGVAYLANPGAGSFAIEIRTNGDYYANFTNLDSTWQTVATVNASNSFWVGRVAWWTNSIQARAQLRVRATSPGWTPIVDFAQWDSALTNGAVFSQYGHQSSSAWWNLTDTNKVFPIWQSWSPDLILLTGGLGDDRTADTQTELQLVKAGFPKSDIVDIGVHEVAAPYTDVFERQYCFSQGIPYFDGQTASIAAWGSYSNGFALGMYQDTAHLTALGYATFGQLIWSWLDLTGSH